MNLLSQNNKQAMRNPWVIGWLSSLIVVVIVNTAFIVTAYKTNPGLVMENYYEQGRNYERTVLQLIDARDSLEWDVSMEVGSVLVSEPATLIVTVLNRKGEAVTGLSGQLQLYRASNQSHDQVVSLSEVESGLYQARYTLVLQGIWDLILTISSDKGDYVVEQRINVIAEDKSG